MVLGALVAATLTADPYANPDSHAFEALARSLIAGHGLVYREPLMPALDLFAFRSPGYAGFLAVPLALGGVRAALALQGALAGATAALFGSAAAWLAGRRAGLLTFAACMLLPFAWRLAGELMSETLYAFVVALAFRLALQAAPPDRGAAPDARPWAWIAIALGLVLALALLTRPIGFGLVAAVVVGLALRVPRVALFTLAVALAAWSPWPVRNARSLHAFVPTLTSGGLNVWVGNSGQAIQEGWRIQAREWRRGEVGLDRMFWRMAWEESRAHPRQVVRRLAGKAVSYLAPPRIRTGQAVHQLLWPLAWFGALAMGREAFRWRWGLALAGLVWLTHALLSVAVVVNDRYRYPTDGFVLLAGVLGAEALLERHGAVRGAAIAIAIAVAGAAVITLVRARF
jgi:4-amino-4-deoxy-L-arabinose transferase-like glycosyltransferase